MESAIVFAISIRMSKESMLEEELTNTSLEDDSSIISPDELLEIIASALLENIIAKEELDSNEEFITDEEFESSLADELTILLLFAEVESSQAMTQKAKQPPIKLNTKFFFIITPITFT